MNIIDDVLATTTTSGEQTNGGSPKKMQSRSSPGPQFENSGLLPSQLMETIKTELVPVSEEGSAIPIKIENYEKFSLDDEIVCSALKLLAEKMKLRFLSNNWIQNEKFELTKYLFNIPLIKYFRDQLLTLVNAVEGLRRATVVVAFVDSPKMENSLTDRLVLLAEFDESEVDRRQTFELVEFNRGEVSAIERLFPFDQSEFLRLFFEYFLICFVLSLCTFSDIRKKIGSIFGAMYERM